MALKHKNDDDLFDYLATAINPVIRDKTFHLKREHTIKNKRVDIQNCVFLFTKKGSIFIPTGIIATLINNTIIFQPIGTKK